MHKARVSACVGMLNAACDLSLLLLPLLLLLPAVGPGPLHPQAGAHAAAQQPAGHQTLQQQVCACTACTACSGSVGSIPTASILYVAGLGVRAGFELQMIASTVTTVAVASKG